MDDFSDVKGRQVAIRDNGTLSEPSGGRHSAAPPSLFSALQASQSASTALIRRLKESKSEVAGLKYRLETAEFRASESRRLLEATIRKHATLRDVKRQGESEQAESSADRQESKAAPRSTELSVWYFVRFIRSVGRGLPSLVVPSLQSSFPAVPRLLATHLGAAVLVCACAVVTAVLVSMQSSLLPTPTESADAAGMAVNPWTDSCLVGGASAWSRTDFWQGTSKAICSQCKMPLGNIVASAKASVSASAVVLAAASTSTKTDEAIAQASPTTASGGETRPNQTELEQKEGKAPPLDTIPSFESLGPVATEAGPAVPSYVAGLQATLDDCQHGLGSQGSCKGLLPAVGHEGRIAYLRHLLIIARVAASGSKQSLDWDAASDPAGGMLFDPRSTSSNTGNFGQRISPGSAPGAAAGSVWLLSGRRSGSTSSSAFTDSASVGSSRESDSASTTSRSSHSRYHGKEVQPPSSVFYPSMPIASLGLGSHFPRHVGPSATWIHSASTLSASDAAAAVGRQSTSSLAAGIRGNDLQATIEFYSFVVAPIVIVAVVVASMVSVGIGGMLRAGWAAHFVVPAVTAAITCLVLLLSLDWYYSGDLASLSPTLGSIVRVPVIDGGSDALAWPVSADASLKRLNLTGTEVEDALKTTPALAVGMEWGLPSDDQAATLRQAPLSVDLHGQAFAARAVYFLVPLRVYQCPLLLAGIVGVSMVLAGLTQLYAGLRMNAVGRRPGNSSRLSMAAAQDAMWGCFSVLSVAMQMLIGAIKSAGGTLCLFLLGALLAISVDHSGMPSDALAAGARTGYQEWQQSPLRLLAHFNVLSAISASMHHVARMSNPGIARKYSRECSKDVLRSSLARMRHSVERNETSAASGIFTYLDEQNGIVRCVNAGSWEGSSPPVEGLQGVETASAEPSVQAASLVESSGGSPVFAALTAPFRVVLRLFVGDQAYAAEPTFPRVVHTLGDWVGSQGGGYFSIGECSRIVGDLVLDAAQVADSMQAGDSSQLGSGSVRSVGSADRIDMRFCGLRHAVAVRDGSSGSTSTVVAVQDTTWWGLLQPTIASVLLIWVPLIAHLTPTPRGFIHTLLSIPKVKDRLHVEEDDQLDRHGDASIVVLDVCGLKVRGKAIRMALSTYGLYLGLCYMCCLVDGLGVHGWPSDFSRLLLGLGWSPVVWVAAGTLTRVADGLILSAFDEEEA